MIYHFAEESFQATTSTGADKRDPDQAGLSPD